MKHKNIIIILGSIFVAIMFFVGIYYFRGNGATNNADALKFKEEYESLNGTKRESDGALYNDIKIDKNNPIKYIDAKEAIEVLKSNQAIIYVGAEWCPWCRNAVPVLFEVAKKYKVDTIYYLNLDSEKSSFEVKDGELVEKVKGSDAYYSLLDVLKDRLSDYKITGEDGTVYDTKEKRIYMPYVIAIKNGHVVLDHVGTVDLDEEQTKYDTMTSAQHDELYSIYNEMFKKVYENSENACGEDVCY